MRVRTSLGHDAATYLLGHQQLSTTADSYTHTLPETRRVAMDKLTIVVFS